MEILKDIFRKKPDPKIDRIPSSVSDSDENIMVSTEGLVTLCIPLDPNDPNGNRPIYVTLNGERHVLYRGKPARVPIEIARIVQNSAGYKTINPQAGRTKVGRDGMDNNPDMGQEYISKYRVEIEQED